jgi:hypothetical protein
MKTAVTAIYEMLEQGKVSDLAEMKEWFMNVEKTGIIKAFNEGQGGTFGSIILIDAELQYYSDTYRELL